MNELNVPFYVFRDHLHEYLESKGFMPIIDNASAENDGCCISKKPELDIGNIIKPKN
jgi:hypothetical protein